LPNLNHKYTQLLFHHLWLIGLVCCLSSCQTRLNIAGDKHKTVAAKWYALANYTQSDVVNYGVSITAELGIELINQKEAFKLTNFKISNKVKRQDINLLSPVFEQKYICIPLCFQLLEYVNFSGIDGATLLDNFFSEHEFELFQFYGDMVLLNPLLESLAEKDPILLSVYLQSLAYKGTTFDSIEAFTLFFEESLSTAAFENFVNNPVDIYAQQLQDYQATPSAYWSNIANIEQDGWIPDTVNSGELLTEGSSQTEENLQPESLWDAGLSSAPEIIWQLESTLVDTSDLKPLSIMNDKSIIDRITPYQKHLTTAVEQLWEEARALNILVGQNVCSYRENLFGQVLAITSGSIEVNLLGQAKVIKDGVITTPKDGSLLDSNLELYFIPLIDRKTFPKEAVVSCLLE
jgi:hypothetical protein